jgi:chromosome segregation ATPase
LEDSKKEQERTSQSLKKAEGYIHAHETKMMRVEGDHAQKVSSLNSTIEMQNKRIAELEKSNKVLQNEKAVLQATVEARESKLKRMEELQSSNEELSVKASRVDAIQSELETSQRRYEDILKTLSKVEGVEKECRQELEIAHKSITALNTRVDEERANALACRAQVDPLQKVIQQLKGERNSYKQKTESLSKEVARLCRNGKSIKDIEKIVAEHYTLSEEVENLRKQKKKALEEAHQYRTSYENSKAAHTLSGVEEETQAVLERNAELARLLAETTEYINAKEMQLETMKQVNAQLQAEIRGLAKAHLGTNEI